jgi:hypothetical protein
VSEFCHMPGSMKKSRICVNRPLGNKEHQLYSRAVRIRLGQKNCIARLLQPTARVRTLKSFIVNHNSPGPVLA